MARVPLIDPDDPGADPRAAELLRALAAEQGAVLDVNRALANHPELLGKLTAFHRTAMSGGLNPRQAQLAYLTSALATPSTPNDAVVGRSAGLTDEQMAHLMDDPLSEAMFSPDEEAIIRFARASARLDPITDEIWADLRRHFPIRTIIEISFLVGMNQLVSRLDALLHTDADEATPAALHGGSGSRAPRHARTPSASAGGGRGGPRAVRPPARRRGEGGDHAVAPSTLTTAAPAKRPARRSSSASPARSRG